MSASLPEDPKGPLSYIRHYLVPHLGNEFKPKIIGITSMTVVLVFVLVIEAGYVFDTQVLFSKSHFLASVVPSVLITLTNQERAENGVGQLTENPLLDEAAQMKANDEAQKGYFSHVSPDGTEPWYWINQAGYDYTYAGENLAINFDDSTQVEDAWMNSPTHRANIVKPEYTDIGIAVAQGMYEGKETTFVVQYFASPGTTGESPQPVQVPATTGNLASAQANIPAQSPPPASNVLGAQQAPPSHPAAPVQLLEVSTTTATTSSSTVVASAGTPAQPTGWALFASDILATPTGAVTYALVALLVLTALLFIIALVAHLRVPYIEGLGATFAVFAIVVGFLAINATYTPHVGLPTSNLSASVVNATPR